MRIVLSQNFSEELKLIILSIVVLNVVDGIMTICSVFTGRAVEANPLMAFLIDCHPVLFMTCKQMLVALGVVLLWRLRRRKLAVFSIFGAFLIYYVNLLHQLQLIDILSVHGWIH